MKKKILWNENGWTVIQNADSEKHILEVTALTQNGNVVEVRVRHNDGEEQVLNKKVGEDITLPMAFGDFKKLVEKMDVKFK